MQIQSSKHLIPSSSHHFILKKRCYGSSIFLDHKWQITKPFENKYDHVGSWLSKTDQIKMFTFLMTKWFHLVEIFSFGNNESSIFFPTYLTVNTSSFRKLQTHLSMRSLRWTLSMRDISNNWLFFNSNSHLATWIPTQSLINPLVIGIIIFISI